VAAGPDAAACTYSSCLLFAGITERAVATLNVLFMCNLVTVTSALTGLQESANAERYSTQLVVQSALLDACDLTAILSSHQRGKAEATSTAGLSCQQPQS